MLNLDHKARSKLEVLRQAELSIQNEIQINKELSMTSNVITLKREYKPNVTLGVMTFPDGTTLQTVELPWKENKTMISCIPEGTYVVKKRASAVVKRTSKGKYELGWEVTNVPNRTYIMVHIGNTVKDFNGCIGVGTARGVLHGLDGVVNSRVEIGRASCRKEC